jgi:peptide/nickel transport system permease protein
VAALLFCVLRLLPVDPAAMSLPPMATIAEVEAKRREMGLDLPLPQQFLIWLGQVLHGDFGTSIHFRRSVASLVASTLPATVELAVIAMAIATALGLGGGLLLFHVRGRAAEPAIDFGSIVLLSIPEFLWALFFILLFGVALGVLPFTGRLSPEFQRPVVTGFLLIDTLLTGRPDMFWDALKHMILPAFALGIAFSPTIMRVLRSSLIDVYHEDYITQARLRGVSERRVLVRHGLKNAILPTLSLMGVQFGILFGGTLLVEVIFSYPGLGNLMVDAVRNADLPIIQAVGLTYCVVVLIINTIVDALYLVLNPKLRIA